MNLFSNILLVGLILPVSLFAQQKLTVTSNIKAATVYQQGAQITRNAKMNISKGKSTLLFKGLSEKVSPESIQVKTDNNVTIVSVLHRIDYLDSKEADKEVLKLEEKRKVIMDSLQMLENIRQVLNEEKTMILSNKSIKGQQGVSISELQKAATFFRERLTEIESKVMKSKQKGYYMKKELVKIAKQLQELNAKMDTPTSVVEVVVSSDKQTSCNAKIKYIIKDAGWTPNYDIRIKDVDAPLGLFYKAKVRQNTGEDWKNIDLTLSTGNPSVSNYKPELNTYYLTFNNYYYKNQYSQKQYQSKAYEYSNNRSAFTSVKGKLLDYETGEPIIGATILVKGTTRGTVTDIYGNYRIDNIPQGHNTLEFSYLGYMSQERYISNSTMNVSLKADMVALEDVVVTKGVRKRSKQRKVSLDKALQGQVAGVQVSSASVSPSIPLAVQKQQTNTEFEIDIPYTIPTDNKEYDVTMIKYEIPAEYNYSAVPKLSDEAYLIAKITDWTEYHLLDGDVNIFFKDSFQGKTVLNLGSMEDTLTMSIGRDSDILISREIEKDFVEKSFMGSTKKEQRSWNITVKNNKKTAVNIIIEDQFPISKTDEIKVERIEQSGAKLDEDTGKLTWDLMLQPNEKKVLNVQYVVKYPKDESVLIE